MSIPFANRPPSATWESIPLPGNPPATAWIWFKPATAPLAILLQIPAELFRNPATRPTLTLRGLLAAVGMDVRLVTVCVVYGSPLDPHQGLNPILDYPLTEPPAGGDPLIALHVHPMAVQPQPMVDVPYTPVVAAGYSGGMQNPMPASSTQIPPGADEILLRMAADWHASLQLEQQLDGMAKQLNATAQRLNGLNRELTPEESRFADSQDKREWQDARRWLRDAVAKISRFLKEHVVGITSAAGKRDSYELIFDQFVAPRRPFDGLVQADRDFSAYRKLLQTLLNNMNSAQGSAVQDAERKAQTLITRMAARVRAGKSKK